MDVIGVQWQVKISHGYGTFSQTGMLVKNDVTSRAAISLLVRFDIFYIIDESEGIKYGVWFCMEISHLAILWYRELTIERIGRRETCV